MNTQQILNMHILNWIPNSGVKPETSDDTVVTATYFIHDEQCYVAGTVSQIDWAIKGQADDIEAYVVGDIRGMI